MPRKKQQPQRERPAKMQGFIAGAGEIVQQDISDTLRQNFMPYAMSVIMSRAIPEIDGFKPSHRKLLYTMYKMGLLGSARTKSANIVGQTMKLNPHGDAAIYDTMVRLSRGYEALLHPYVDSKGNFGKAYSRDMAWAASRYTEAQPGPHLPGAVPGYRQGHGGLCGQLRQHHEGAHPAARHLPQRAGQRQHGHRRGHGQQHLPLQPGGGVPHHHRPASGTRKRTCSPPCRPRISPAAARSSSTGTQMEKIYETGRGSFRVRSRYSYDKAPELHRRDRRSRPPPPSR